MGGDRRRQGVRGVVEGKFEQNRTSGLEIQREDAGDREPFEGLNALSGEQGGDLGKDYRVWCCHQGMETWRLS
jgi:hypothetical protein